VIVDGAPGAPGRLEALVRAEPRREGCAVDDALAELLFEMTTVAKASVDRRAE
jgi:hypothetical protein